MNRTWTRIAWSFIWFLGCVNWVTAADPEAQVLQELENAKAELTSSNYLLRYKYQPGETIRYAVEQLVSVDTSIAGNRQQTQLRSRSGRSLKMEAVDPSSGVMQFAHTVEYVDMWSEVTGREAQQYDSRKDKDPPPGYEQVAQNIGKPISTIFMSPLGQIVDRRDLVPQPDLGLGGVSIPFPEAEIPIGFTWNQPLEVKVRLEDQRIKVVKTREVYRLERVETGVATISIKTEVLTPLDDARVKSQIIQRISQGEMRFDIDSGRLLSRQLDWDESVVGFAGADSNMKYLSRFTETLEKSAEVASNPTATTAQ